MSYSATPNLNLRKPVVGADADAWGGDWNWNADTLDSTIHGLGAGPFLPLSGGGTVSGALTVQYPGTANALTSTPTHPSAAYPAGGGSQLFSYYIAAAAGGTPGDVNANGQFYSSITGAPNAYVFNLLAVADYNGTGGNGQDVASYHQAIRRRRNAGGTASNPEIFAAVFEAIDFTNTDSALTNTLNGIEIDITCGNTDSAQNRRGIGLYLNHANAGDVAPVCHTGLHLAANLGSYNRIIQIQAPYNIAGIDFRDATQAGGNAIWLKTGQYIGLDNAGTGGAAHETLWSDGNGVFISAPTGFPARITYQIGGSGGYWMGAWTDGDFYLSGPGGNALTLTPAGGMTLGGALTLNADPAAMLQPVTLQYYNAHLPVVPAASSTTPVMDGTAAVGVGTTWARADHVHASDTSRLPLAGGIMTGGISLGATTASASDDFTRHLLLFDAGSATGNYGISVTGGRLNLQAGGPGTVCLMANGVDRLLVSPTGMGFNGTAASAKPTISGACAGNTAIKALLTALQTYGLVTDSTSA